MKTDKDPTLQYWFRLELAMEQIYAAGGDSAVAQALTLIPPTPRSKKKHEEHYKVLAEKMESYAMDVASEGWLLR